MELRKRHTAPLARRIPNTVTVLGDSMMPEFHPGDMYHYVPANRVFYDGIYVLEIDGYLMVKQVQRLPGGILRVSSINNRYSPFDIDEENPALEIRGHDLHIAGGSTTLFRTH